MDITSYRLHQFEKRADLADARLVRIEDKLTEIQVTLAGVATQDSLRNWGVATMAIVVATGVGIGAMWLRSSGNQLSAFQAGFATIQSVAASREMHPAEPVPTH